ncbi:uncharacterized protein LOC112184978 [Rosa chinensis]|uniref:uncharacterized protein LOC112184978 n=1 Tax=Rosa chinensis TaxID=74649 RepID=UPI000D095C78|nr:uncharacterized protein LOC112184978 [Rosa chinensis]
MTYFLKPKSPASFPEMMLLKSHFNKDGAMIRLIWWQCDFPLLQEIFTGEEATAIAAIPLSRRVVIDRLCWKLSKDGKFSVKTTYRYAFMKSASYSPLQLPVGSGFWKKLWKVVIPNKAKIHVWRACLDILPSLGSLASKRVVLDSNICVLCESHTETTIHLCRDCPYTRRVLHTNAMLQQERNYRLWNQKRCEARDVSLGIVSRLQEFRVHNLKRYQPKVKREAVWKAPPVGVVKVNVDGAFHHTSKKGGLGFVFRNENGIMLGGGAWPLRGLNSPEHAEILACKVALEFAEVHGFGPIILETDALEVQRQLSLHDSINLLGIGRIYDDVVALLEAQSVIQVTHMGRKGVGKSCLLLQFTDKVASF